MTGTLLGEPSRGTDHTSASHDKQIGFMCSGRFK